MNVHVTAHKSDCLQYLPLYHKDNQSRSLEICLDSHLQVEDQHTQEAVGADEREVGLRQRVAELEEGLRSVNTAGAMQRHVAARYVR